MTIAVCNQLSIGGGEERKRPTTSGAFGLIPAQTERIWEEREQTINQQLKVSSMRLTDETRS